MATLGDLERTVMDLLWATTESTTANELRDAIAEVPAPETGRELAVTTVLTVLSRLEKKGLVERERNIRPHHYRSVTSREDHTAELMHEVLVTAPDRNAVLARFIGSVSEAEAQTLRTLLGGS